MRWWPAVFLRGLLMAVVWAAECFALYRLYPTGLADSVRFALPALIGFLFFLGVMWIRFPGRQRHSPTMALVFAVLLDFAAFWMGMFICVNAFGS